MSDVHVLVDLENVRPPAVHLENLSPKFVRAWVFHASQDKKAEQEFAVIGERLTLVPISRPSKNALDFHLSFYLGYIAARNPRAELVIVSNDKGYEPMIEHAVALSENLASRSSYGRRRRLLASALAVRGWRRYRLRA